MQKFWQKVIQLLQEITGIRMPKDPETYILHNAKFTEIGNKCRKISDSKMLAIARESNAKRVS